MSALATVARESFVILNVGLTVISANSTFYRAFHVSPEQTENRPLYELGNGQWNIPALRDLLEQILPEKKEIRDYEVTHTFETIGEKTILLNAKQIDSEQLIILAMEDITTRKNLEEKLAEQAKKLEIKVAERTAELANQVKELAALNETMTNRELKMIELKKEIEDLKKRRNGNGHARNGKSG